MPNAIARRARLLTTLAGLPTRRGVRFLKALAQAMKATAQAEQRALRFLIAESDGRQSLAASLLVIAPTRSLPADGTAKATLGEVPAHTPGAAQVTELDAISTLVDHFDVRRELADTVITLAQDLPIGTVSLTDTDLAHWAELLEAGTPTKALAHAQRQVQRLSAALMLEQSQHTAVDESHRIDAGSATFELLSRVVSDTTNSVAIIGRDAHVQWVNQAFETLTGCSQAKAVGAPFDQLLFGAESDPEWRSRLRRMMEEDKSVSGERLHQREDGTQNWCAFNISPLHQPDGTLAGWVDIGWDTTAARQARDQLEQARKNAEAASRAKSEFLANMSHEIRTPMNTIIGMTELALATRLSAQQEDYLCGVRDSAHSLLRMLNNVLDLSKIEARKLQLEEVDFNIHELFGEALRTIKHQAEHNAIELTWKICRDVPVRLRGDPTRLRQILVNLLSNAVKFTNKGEITVSLEKQWSGGGEIGLQLSVRDTGIGIPPDRLSAIFEAFAQVDSATTRTYGGTGLGLTITAELLRLMNGRIWVDSTVGVGSTFHCTLRMRVAQGPPESLVQTATEPLARRKATPLHILIADDHAPNRKLVAEILRKRGHTSDEAENGQQVLELLKQNRFHVILMDVQMPELDGLATTAAIRAAERESLAHQPIVAVTAYALKGDSQRCLNAGMDAYLAKPIDATELVRVVETLSEATPHRSVPKASPSRAVEMQKLPYGSRVTPQDEPAGFDFQRALARLGGDETLLRRQMGFFVDEAPRLVHQLVEAVSASDEAVSRLAAHRLTGLVSSYDHQRAAEIARQVEQRIAEGRLGEVDLLVSQLRQHVEELLDAIRRHCQ